MMPLLQAAFDPETFRQQGHRLVDLLANHLQRAESAENPVLAYTEPSDQLAFWQRDFAQPANADPLPLFTDMLSRSIHLHNPRFMGHQVAVPLPLTALTGLLTGMLNQGQAVYEMGMTANALEQIVTQWLARKLSFGPESGGILTSGGTLANLTALLTARALRAPGDVWENGHSNTRLAIMLSEEAHYCVDRAARIMGLGSEGIIKIPTNERFQMRTDLLENYLADATARGLTVFAVIGSCCSTSTGSYDGLEAIADFCQQHSLWFHADGAHGGAVVLSDRLKPVVRGIERADSVVVDFHKMMMIPALATALIYQRDTDAFRTFQQRAQYLWADATATDWFSSGKRTFECTKLMMSAKIYTVLRTYGEDLIRQHVEIVHDLAQQFAEMLRQRADFELAVTPESNIVCFRYVGDGSLSEAGLNALNSQIRQQLLKEGRFYIVQTNLRDQTYLRVSLMNPLTTVTQLEELLDSVTEKTGMSESHN